MHHNNIIIIFPIGHYNVDHDVRDVQFVQTVLRTIIWILNRNFFHPETIRMNRDKIIIVQLPPYTTGRGYLKISAGRVAWGRDNFFSSRPFIYCSRHAFYLATVEEIRQRGRIFNRQRCI